MEHEQILHVENICKSFASTRALHQVSLDVCRGQVMGLVGENGSGKSTLTSIVSGNLKADSGSMRLFGEEYLPLNNFDAAQKGVVMIVQEQGTIGTISVASNLFAGREQMFCKLGMLDRKKLQTEARALLEKVGAGHIDVNVLAEELTFEDRKLVEMARALYLTPELFIVDETTTALSQKGRDILYRIVAELKAQNRAVLFITHDISELLSICNIVTVLRDGEYIATLEGEEMQAHKIKSLMVGREVLEDIFHKDRSRSPAENEVVLRVDGVSTDLLKDVSLELRKGEILGIGGLTDCGMHDLAKVVFGLIKPDTGAVTTGAGTKITSARIAIQNKIGFVSKNRDKEALLSSASIADNIALPSLDLLQTWGLIPRSREKALAVKWSDALAIKMRDISQHCNELSGGNKQKVVLAKWLGNESNILIMDCPTRGIDIGVKEAIYQMMNSLTAEGKSIIMISEELPEVLGVSDRIIMMQDGHITKTFEDTASLTEETVIHYMI